MDYILNEDSLFCCLPENFTDYHVDLLDNVSDDDIKKAKEVLERAEKQKQNKTKDDFGFVITDWKSNKPKNFEVHHYTGRLYPPFNNYHDNALGHYYLQLPLYGRLLRKMLEGTKYDDTKLLGNVVVLLKDDATFVEYKVPSQINNAILQMDLSKYISRWSKK